MDEAQLFRILDLEQREDASYSRRLFRPHTDASTLDGLIRGRRHECVLHGEFFILLPETMMSTFTQIISAAENDCGKMIPLTTSE